MIIVVTQRKARMEPITDESLATTWSFVERWLHNGMHVALVFGAVYISQHPEYAPYAVVLQAWGQFVRQPK